MNGDQKWWSLMKKYNKQDVLLLEKVYNIFCFHGSIEEKWLGIIECSVHIVVVMILNEEEHWIVFLEGSRDISADPAPNGSRDRK